MEINDPPVIRLLWALNAKRSQEYFIGTDVKTSVSE
jgi:hypothetical protein